MRKTCLNGHNLRMRRIAALAVVALIAGCGGGSSSQSTTAPAKTSSPSGGVVTAEPTKGILAPAIGIDNGKIVITGRGGAISPKEDRPTDAQEHGVAGSGACASTSANPSPSNLGRMSAAILCLLNAERRSKGLSSLH